VQPHQRHIDHFDSQCWTRNTRAGALQLVSELSAVGRQYVAQVVPRVCSVKVRYAYASSALRILALIHVLEEPLRIFVNLVVHRAVDSDQFGSVAQNQSEFLLGMLLAP